MKEYHTKYKDLIKTYVDEHKDSRISAAGIYESLTAQGIPINLATVYRHLDKLTDEGTLKKYKTNNAKQSYYQHASPKCAHHLHLQCSRCGKIIHLDCECMEIINAHILGEHGFKLDCANSVLTGLCKECQEEMQHG